VTEEASPVTTVPFLCIRHFAVLVVLLSCSAPIFDANLVLNLEGSVTDAQGAGIAGVTVFFVDTGIDSRRTGARLLAGHTDDKGHLSEVFEYLYSYRLPRQAADEKLSFVLRFEHPDYEVAETTHEVGGSTRRASGDQIAFAPTLVRRE
jgi:hypothetical protein